MIYLFNSAYNKTYLENVYRLVGLPSGVRVDMRYTEATNAPPVSADAEMVDQECTICYIDRFSDRYQYFPFRRARIRAIKREQKRVFYSVELLAHCHSDSPREFTRTIQTAIPSAPRLTGDPQNSDDGIYCVAGQEAGDLVKTESDSWVKAVDQIYGAKAFLTEAPALFLVNIERGGSKPSGSKSGLELHANTEYELSVHYRYPFARGDAGQRRLLMKMGTEVNRELTVGSASDRLIVPITLPPLDFSAGAITVETLVEMKGSSGGEVRFTATVPFRTSAWRSNLVLFGLLLLIVFFDAFIKADWDFKSGKAWAAMFFDFLKFAIVVWAIFKYRGKLKLPGL